MSFAEQRAILRGEFARLEEVIRQAHELSRSLEERTEELSGATETLADDTLLARLSTTARKTRQDLGTLRRSVAAAKDQLQATP